MRSTPHWSSLTAHSTRGPRWVGYRASKGGGSDALNPWSKVGGWVGYRASKGGGSDALNPWSKVGGWVGYRASKGGGSDASWIINLRGGRPSHV